MIPKELKEVYEKGAFGLYIGAGISQASGLPSWSQLLTELIDLAEEYNISKDKCNELRTLIKDPSKYLLIAEDLKELLPGDLFKYFKNRFDNRKDKPSELLRKIIKLRTRFIITTNYDTLIEKAYIEINEQPNDITYKDASTINYNLLNNERFLLKAHGDARRSPDEIIITERDYRQIIFREKGYQSVLYAMFSMCHVLFLGVSLNDPELRLMLGFIHNIFHGGSPEHFAIMSNKNLSKTEIDRWRKDFRITIIGYDPKNNHEELENFINELLKF
jgi:hypothetical protein